MLPNLQIDNLSYSYDEAFTIETNSFELVGGCIYGIAGTSGSGKTTLAKLMSGRLRPNNGTITLNGRALDKAFVAGDIAFIEQHAKGLLPYMSILGNAALPFLVREKKWGFKSLRFSHQKMCIEALKLARIDHAARIYPGASSGGMLARGLIARSLAQRPSLLIFDEAFSGIDEVMCQSLHEDIIALTRESKRITIIISHRINELVFLSDRIFVLGRSENATTLRDDFAVEFGSARDTDIFTDPKFSEYANRIRKGLL